MPRSPFRASREMVEIARRLRSEMTPAETKLWQKLRGRQFHGFKFRRQHPLGCFVVDFYCPEKKLIIEVDGGVHESLSQRCADAEREEWLKALELRIVRLPNDLVLTDMKAALDIIADALLRLPSTG